MPLVLQKERGSFYTLYLVNFADITFRRREQTCMKSY